MKSEITPDGMKEAGRLLNNRQFTDEELETAVSGLNLIIPFLEEVGHSRYMLNWMNAKLKELKRFQTIRER